MFFIILSYIILLYRTGKNTIKLMKKKTFNENFLVTISCIGALLIGEELEGLMVIILYEIGKILEENFPAKEENPDEISNELIILGGGRW